MSGTLSNACSFTKEANKGISVIHESFKVLLLHVKCEMTLFSSSEATNHDFSH